MTEFVQGSIFDDLPEPLRSTAGEAKEKLAKAMSTPKGFSGIIKVYQEVKKFPLSLEGLYMSNPEIAQAAFTMAYATFVSVKGHFPNPAELWISFQTILHGEPMETVDDGLGPDFLQAHVPWNEQQLMMYLVAELKLEVANFLASTHTIL